MTMTLVEDGESIRYTNPSATATIPAGTPIMVEAVLGVAADEILPGEEGALEVVKVHKVRKDSSAPPKGAALFWNLGGTSVGGDTGCLTLVSVGNQFAGIAWEAALATDETVDIKLMAAHGGEVTGYGVETHVIFTENPITTGVGGGASVGTDNAVNVFRVNDETFEIQNNGTQTLLGPVLSADGLVISLDLTDDEGANIDQGITALCKSAVTVGEVAAALRIKFKVADVSGLDGCYLGWRKLAARNDDVTAYTDFAVIGPISGAITTMTDLNGSGSEVITDTSDAWTDGEVHTLEVRVSAAGVVSYSIDGVAPTVAPAVDFTFDDGDVIIPFWQHIHATTTPGAITWQEYHVNLG